MSFKFKLGDEVTVYHRPGSKGKNGTVEKRKGTDFGNRYVIWFDDDSAGIAIPEDEIEPRAQLPMPLDTAESVQADRELDGN